MPLGITEKISRFLYQSRVLDRVIHKTEAGIELSRTTRHLVSKLKTVESIQPIGCFYYG